MIKKVKKSKIVLLIILFIISSFISAHSTMAAANLDVSFIDVGQGSSVLVRYNGKNTLIDTGDEKYYQKLKDYLSKKKIKRIDQLVITHNHPDHIGNADKIISSYKVQTVIVSKYGYNKESSTKDVKEFNQEVKKHKVKTVKVKKGSKINFGGLLKGTVLSPGKNYTNTNKSSIVIRLVHEKNSFLFTGDIYSPNEKELAKKYNLKSTVLQVSHHGSYTSSCSIFLKKVKPKYAVISCGKNNPYGHPRPEAVGRLQKYAKKIYRTDKNGTITFCSSAKRIAVKKE